MRFALIIFVCAFLMEFVSYLAHRYIYHGIGWLFHKSHHSAREGAFEWNDIFPLCFSAISISIMAWGVLDASRSDAIAVAIGVSTYGMIYFFIHDLYIHRRAKWLRIRIPWFQKMKRAHAIHHAFGGEPYGLLFYWKLDKSKKNQPTLDNVDVEA
ncbi:MAG: sterol desaturase family protein [Ignavibacteria bacterium]|nr:sterol desaturase family protein [Ignavibacteria bacterium]